jgi:ATP-dependent Clp protease ATP-binding subunit ClpA
MFERYTEKARRVIFFARLEASRFGSPYIETEHLLLGLLREDKALSNRFLRSHASVESIRKQIEDHTMPGDKVSTSVDLPLSNESKRVLGYAAEEAGRLGQKHIGTEHLLLGLLREEQCFAAQILQERGLRLAQIREQLGQEPHADIELKKWHTSDAGLVITSEPLGAEIEIDGAFYGNTPAELPLPEGEKTIRLTLKGFHPWERKLQVVHGGQQNVNGELERLPS